MAYNTIVVVRTLKMNNFIFKHLSIWISVYKVIKTLYSFILSIKLKEESPARERRVWKEDQEIYHFSFCTFFMTPHRDQQLYIEYDYWQAKLQGHSSMKLK